MKERLKNIIYWAMFAFFIGAFAAVGSKTIDYVWPDKPVEVNISQTKYA